MSPLTLTARLRSAAPPGMHALHLDALFGVVAASRDRRRDPPTQDTPIGRVRRGEAPGILHVDHGGEWCHAASAVGVSRDGLRARWCFYGGRGEARRSAKSVLSAGRELRIDGDAYTIASWEIEHADHSLTQCYTSRGAATRALPEGWVESAERWTRGAHESPYWHPGRQHRSPEIGSPVVLTEAALGTLRAIDLDHTRAMAGNGGMAPELQARHRARLVRLAQLERA